MEYHHPGVGTIVQSTWWVQCMHHVHVVYGHNQGHSYMYIKPLEYVTGWASEVDRVVIEQALSVTVSYHLALVPSIIIAQYQQ